MRKLLTLCLCLCAALNLSAQEKKDKHLFNHLGAGVGVGTSGVSVDVAMPCTRFLQVRAGVDIMPNISFNANVDYNYSYDNPASPGTTITEKGTAKLKGELKRVQGHLILNVYPIPKCNFFIAAGAYFGGNKLFKISGHSEELAELQTDDAKVIIGDYNIPADKDGNVSGGFKIKGFRPYLGLGFGRSVPKRRLSFATELGVQFEGKPQLYTDYGELEPELQNPDDDTFKKVTDALRVYPMLTFRLNFRAF